jgi:hypothetical protein
LARERFDASFLRYQSGVDFRQGCWRFAALRTITPAKTRTPASLIPLASFTSFAAARPGCRAFRPAGTPAFTPWAVAFTARSWRPVPPRWSRAAAVAPAFGTVHFPFVLGVLGRRGLFLRPSGQEQLLQIEFVIR